MMKDHKCKPATTCTCNRSALTPDESCPVHGSGEFPPRCAECGKYLSYKIEEKMSNPDPEEIIDKYRHKGTTSGISRATWGSVHIRKMMQEHTGQTLDRLKGRLDKQTLMNIVAGCIKTTRKAHDGEIKTTSLAKRIGSQVNAIIEEVSDE